MFQIKRSSKFEKQYERFVRQGNDPSKIDDTISLLAKGEPLPHRYQEHKLQGKLAGLWECHVGFDLLLVYAKDKGRLVILMLGMGAHADLFK